MSPWYSHDIVDYIWLYPIISHYWYNHHYSHEISSIPMINFLTVLTPMVLSWCYPMIFPWYPHDIWAKSPSRPSPTWSSPGISSVEVPKAGASSTLAAPTSLSISRLAHGDPWAHDGPWRDLRGTHSLKKKGMVLDDVHSWRYFKIHTVIIVL